MKRQFHHEDPREPALGLPEYLGAIWREEFAAVASGHFCFQDHPAMADHCRLVAEERAAFKAMLATNRSRDSATHWRSMHSLVMASRRTLRLTLASRIRPERVGVLAAGRVYFREEQARSSGKNDWRALFPPEAGDKGARPSTTPPAPPGTLPTAQRKQKVDES